MANGRTTAVGWEGREAQLPEVWKAEGKPPGGQHFGLGGRSPPEEGKDVSGGGEWTLVTSPQARTRLTWAVPAELLETKRVGLSLDVSDLSGGEIVRL